MAKPKVHRGLEIRIGLMRVVVAHVGNEVAEVHVIFDKTSIGTGCAVPVEAVEKLLDWHGKLPTGLIDSV